MDIENICDRVVDLCNQAGFCISVMPEKDSCNNDKIVLSNLKYPFLDKYIMCSFTFPTDRRIGLNAEAWVDGKDKFSTKEIKLFTSEWIRMSKLCDAINSLKIPSKYLKNGYFASYINYVNKKR